MLLRLFARKLIINVHDTPRKAWFNKTIQNREDNHVLIPNFPFGWFNKKLKSAYGTTRLSKLYKVAGWQLFGRADILVHKFFLPEFLYLLDTVGGHVGSVKRIIDDIACHTWIKDLYSPGNISIAIIRSLSVRFGCGLMCEYKRLIRSNHIIA